MFSVWTPAPKHSGLDLVIFEFTEPVILDRVEVYTTNYQSFGINPKIRSEDNSVILTSDLDGGLSVHYLAHANEGPHRVYTNGQNYYQYLT